MISTRTLVSLTAALLASLVAAAATSVSRAPGETPLTAHLLRAGELAGFAPNGAPEVVRAPRVRARQTAAGSAAEETAALRRLGFAAAAREHLRSRGRDDRHALVRRAAEPPSALALSAAASALARRVHGTAS